MSRAASELPGAAPLESGLGGYELLQPIGQGGSGAIFLARRAGTGVDRTFAFKVLFDRLAGNPELGTRLLETARLVGRLRHRHIAEVYDAGTSGATFFVAMEHVAGWDLAAVRRQLATGGRKAPVDVALRVAADACAGLEYAHDGITNGTSRTILHGGLQPANVLLTRQGIVKLVDFGIAVLAGPPGAAGSADREPFWAPEQLRGEPADTRADLFSLGATLFVLLTGWHPFQRGSNAATRQAMVNDEPRDPRTLRPDLPEGVVALLRRALEPDRERRFGSAREMGAALASELARLAPSPASRPATATASRTGAPNLAAYFSDLFDAETANRATQMASRLGLPAPSLSTPAPPPAPPPATGPASAIAAAPPPERAAALDAAPSPPVTQAAPAGRNASQTATRLGMPVPILPASIPAITSTPPGPAAASGFPPVPGSAAASGFPPAPGSAAAGGFPPAPGSAAASGFPHAPGPSPAIALAPVPLATPAPAAAGGAIATAPWPPSPGSGPIAIAPAPLPPPPGASSMPGFAPAPFDPPPAEGGVPGFAPTFPAAPPEPEVGTPAPFTRASGPVPVVTTPAPFTRASGPAPVVGTPAPFTRASGSVPVVGTPAPFTGASGSVPVAPLPVGQVATRLGMPAPQISGPPVVVTPPGDGQTTQGIPLRTIRRVLRRRPLSVGAAIGVFALAGIVTAVALRRRGGDAPPAEPGGDSTAVLLAPAPAPPPPPPPTEEAADPPEPPPPQVRHLSSLTGPGGVWEGPVLQKIIRRARRKFAACLRFHGDSPSKTRRQLAMFLRVSGGGRVTQADVNLVGVDDEGLADCLESEAVRLRFPRFPEKEVRFSFPVTSPRPPRPRR
jgi:eukaryotic-like serine/threonine-protein kinase